MQVGKVIGNVWATRKHDDLGGCKLMVVEPLGGCDGSRDLLVAVDIIGAGVGETVLLVSGSSARLAAGTGADPVDCVIVGIVDKVDLPGQNGNTQ